MSPARTRRALCALLLLSSVSAAGCASGRINAWPLFFHEARRVQTPEGPKVVTSTDVVYPIFHRESEPGTSWYAVRPFYNYQHGPEPGRHQVQYLWPLGLYFKDGTKITEWRLWILAAYISTWSDLHQRYSTHAHVLQLLRWGNDAELGPYLAFIPLAGVTHKFIGDTWSFVLFPLFSYYRQGTYTRTDFPWPILGYGATPNKSKVMYRAFPFFVYQRNTNLKGTYVRYDAPWPLLRWGGLDLGGQYYSTVLAVTPLFSTVRTWDRQGQMVAHRTSILGFAFENDKREQKRASDWGALWWLVQRKSAPRRDDFRIFPFYWQTTYYRSAAKDPATSWTRVRAPWPIIWIDHSRLEPGVDRSAFFVSPFYWQYTDAYQKEGEPDRTARRITLWPLATWAHDKDDGYHFYLLSHGWNDTTHGYERNYRAFFDIFQYHSTAKGEREVRVLSRLYHSRSTPTGNYLSVAGLFTYDGTQEVVGQEGKYVSALFGLVKCSWTEQKRHWRIFFIPVN
jgi:hypothetical protein